MQWLVHLGEVDVGRVLPRGFIRSLRGAMGWWSLGGGWWLEERAVVLRGCSHTHANPCTLPRDTHLPTLRWCCAVRSSTYGRKTGFLQSMTCTCTSWCLLSATSALSSRTLSSSVHVPTNTWPIHGSIEQMVPTSHLSFTCSGDVECALPVCVSFPTAPE